MEMEMCKLVKAKLHHFSMEMEMCKLETANLGLLERQTLSVHCWFHWVGGQPTPP
jgi:hypothetical protein